LNTQRPDIFEYHDYRVFLRDWFSFLKKQKGNQSQFSLRALARRAGLGSGYLPMVIGGTRPLSGAMLAKLLPYLELNANEQSFLENLLVLGNSDSHAARVTALDRMKRFQQYQKLNPRDTEVYHYLTHWFYVAIREMAAMRDFRADPHWIQEHFRVSIPLKEIKDALEFLQKNDYLKTNADGSIQPPKKVIECHGGVYRVALSQFHKEVLALAAKAIENTPSEERNIQGHTFPMSDTNLQKAKEIVDEAIAKVRALSELETQADSVYHMEVALFPLTRKPSRSKRKK